MAITYGGPNHLWLKFKTVFEKIPDYLILLYTKQRKFEPSTIKHYLPQFILMSLTLIEWLDHTGISQIFPAATTMISCSFMATLMLISQFLKMERVRWLKTTISFLCNHTIHSRLKN